MHYSYKSDLSQHMTADIFTIASEYSVLGRSLLVAGAHTSCVVSCCGKKISGAYKFFWPSNTQNLGQFSCSASVHIITLGNMCQSYCIDHRHAVTVTLKQGISSHTWGRSTSSVTLMQKIGAFSTGTCLVTPALMAFEAGFYPPWLSHCGCHEQWQF
jgi:hypothetical protein